MKPFVVITPLSFDHRVRWPDGVSSLDHFRTVAFDHAMMRSMISFGWIPINDPQRPWVRESFGPILNNWMHLVPECYRTKVGEIATEMFNRVFKGQLYREWVLDQFIKELRDALYEKLEPILPGS